MRTTLNIDDHLYRKVKVRAAIEGRTITELVETALRGLMEGTSTKLFMQIRINPKELAFPLLRRANCKE